VPELPEVETLRRGLERTALDRRVTDLLVTNIKVLKGQSEAIFRERVLGKSTTKVERRGKYLLITLSDPAVPHPSNAHAVPSPPVFLCIHLKMRGHVRIEENAASVPGPYLCVTLYLENLSEPFDTVALRFYDMWTWGEMRALYPEECEREAPGLFEMGEEPLDAAWGADALAAKLRTRKSAIKPTLLDQTVVAGVGNIYADESLFRAGIRPTRPSCTLTQGETERLASAVRSVLSEAVNGGGTASDEFFDVAGRPGRFVPQVYDRGGKPCPRCGTELMRIRLGGRGTVFCDRCQSAE